MKFTFGIIASETAQSRNFVEAIEHSIELYGGSESETIIVRDDHIFINQIYEGKLYSKTCGMFKMPRKGWITGMKNFITKEARYENVVYLHDYYTLYPGWHKGFQKFDTESSGSWDIAMNVVMNDDETRFRDWITWDDKNVNPKPWLQKEPWTPKEGLYREGSPAFVPYDYSNTKKMSYSGGYWVAKKEFMMKYPLNEDIVWGEAEDVEHFDRIRDFCSYKMNKYSAVKLLKHKDPIHATVSLDIMKPEYIKKELVSE